MSSVQLLQKQTVFPSSLCEQHFTYLVKVKLRDNPHQTASLLVLNQSSERKIKEKAFDLLFPFLFLYVVEMLRKKSLYALNAELSFGWSKHKNKKIKKNEGGPG